MNFKYLKIKKSAATPIR